MQSQRSHRSNNPGAQDNLPLPKNMLTHRASRYKTPPNKTPQGHHEPPTSTAKPAKLEDKKRKKIIKISINAPITKNISILEQSTRANSKVFNSYDMDWKISDFEIVK